MRFSRPPRNLKSSPWHSLRKLWKTSSPLWKSVHAVCWIISFARGKKGMPMAERLARELMDAYNNEGSSVKKREDTHKMAEANRAFAHYRW